MITCYIALGSNLNEPLRQITSAIKALGELPQSHVLDCSPLYHSAPMGPQDQPEYINAVLGLGTALEPLALLDELQRIEHAHGRQRDPESHWGPRTLDLDLLLYGDALIKNSRLTVPHYGIRERPFVLYPLADIAPDLRMPDDGTPLQQLLSQCPRGNLAQLEMPQK